MRGFMASSGGLRTVRPTTRSSDGLNAVDGFDFNPCSEAFEHAAENAKLAHHRLEPALEAAKNGSHL